MASNVSYDRRTGPYQEEFRGRDQFGRSASLGRWESDRSLEERYGPGYSGDRVTISDFLRHGRDRYSRAGYGKSSEAYRRSPAARSQSIARMDNRRFADDRYASQPRFDDCYERYPREYQLEDRYARDCPEDRYTGNNYGRQYDDRSFYDSDRYMSARPGFERYMTDRPDYNRSRSYDRVYDRMAHDRFATDMPRRDRMHDDRYDNQFSRERNQRYGNDRHTERYAPGTYDRQMTNQRFGDDRSQKQERFTSEERRYRSDGEKRTNERFTEQRRMSGDRRTSVVKPITDSFAPERRMSSDRVQERRLSSDRSQARRLSTDRAQEMRLSSDRVQERRLSSDRGQARRLSTDRPQERRLSSDRVQERRLSTDRGQARRLSTDRPQERRLSSDRVVKPSSDRYRTELPTGHSEEKFAVERERRLSVDRERRLSIDRERPSVDCTERFVKL